MTSMHLSINTSELYARLNEQPVGFGGPHVYVHVIGSTVVLDETEIADAMWCRKDDLPQIPQGISIARRLIDDWVAGA
jgi:hypothetical protein